jgi:hypothetical protein
VTNLSKMGGRCVFGVVAILAAAGTASAQFATSITRPTFSLGPATLDVVNVQTGTSALLLDTLAVPAVPATAAGFTGLAYDAANQRLFASITNGTSSAVYSVDVVTGARTLLFSVRRPDNSAGMVIDGLAFDQKRRVLYATRTIGGTGQNESLYTLNQTTGIATQVFQYEPTTGSDFTIGGIDWCPVTDKIYLTDDDDTLGRNIFSYTPGSAAELTLVTAYEAGATDVDGIAAGGGKLYLLSDSQDAPATLAIEGNSGLHRVFNLTTGLYETPITSGYPVRTTTNMAFGLIDPSGGGAWVARGCTASDVAGPGPSVGPDNELTADDIILFIGWFTGGDLRADVAGPGPSAGSDGELTADDIILFINRFTTGCLG